VKTTSFLSYFSSRVSAYRLSFIFFTDSYRIYTPWRTHYAANKSFFMRCIYLLHNSYTPIDLWHMAYKRDRFAYLRVYKCRGVMPKFFAKLVLLTRIRSNQCSPVGTNRFFHRNSPSSVPFSDISLISCHIFRFLHWFENYRIFHLFFC